MYNGKIFIICLKQKASVSIKFSVVNQPCKKSCTFAHLRLTADELEVSQYKLRAELKILLYIPKTKQKCSKARMYLKSFSWPITQFINSIF